MKINNNDYKYYLFTCVFYFVEINLNYLNISTVLSSS